MNHLAEQFANVRKLAVQEKWEEFLAGIRHKLEIMKYRDEFDCTLLTETIELFPEYVLTEVLQEGAEVNVVTKTGCTAAHALIEKDMTEEAYRKLIHLLDAGFNPELGNIDHWTLLHTAAYEGEERLVDLLLERGANPTAISLDEETPADLAQQKKHHHLAEKLRAANSKQEGK